MTADHSGAHGIASEITSVASESSSTAESTRSHSTSRTKSGGGVDSTRNDIAPTGSHQKPARTGSESTGSPGRAKEAGPQPSSVSASENSGSSRARDAGVADAVANAEASARMAEEAAQRMRNMEIAETRAAVEQLQREAAETASVVATVDGAGHEEDPANAAPGGESLVEGHTPQATTESDRSDDESAQNITGAAEAKAGHEETQRKAEAETQAIAAAAAKAELEERRRQEQEEVAAAAAQREQLREMKAAAALAAANEQERIATLLREERERAEAAAKKEADAREAAAAAAVQERDAILRRKVCQSDPATFGAAPPIRPLSRSLIFRLQNWDSDCRS